MALLGLFPFTRSQWFDNNGSPLTGGFVYAYASGTDTPATIFKDAYGLIAHEWPLELDDAGSAKVYLSPIAYKIVIKNQFGELVEERDPVYSNGFSGGSDETGTWAVVDNYDALRNLTQQVDAVLVMGRNTPNDGGSGIFILDVDETGIDDDGIVLVRNTTDRYVRQLNGYIAPEWYGALYNQAIDNSAALTAAGDASIAYNLPVNINGSLYFNSNFSVKSGVKINLNGAVTSPAGISFKFKSGSQLLSASKNSFAQNIQPMFDAGVCDALRVSWFGGGFSQIIASTTFNYQLLIDTDVSVNADLDIPANFEVDFVGGSKLVVKSLADVKLNNLIYNGTGTIIVYQSASYIKAVVAGKSYCYLEWFGGVAGSAIDTDNSIAFKAAVAHGNIFLISPADKFYNVPAGAYSNSNGLVMVGNYIPNNNTANDAVPSTIRFAEGANLTVGNMTLTGVKITGSGHITAAETTIKDAIISGTVGYSTGLSKVNDSIAVDPSYIVAGASGKLIQTSDIGGSWVTETSGIATNINSIAKNSKMYVLVGAGGVIKTSLDGSTWTSRASGTTQALNCVKWISAVNKFIAVGEGGIVLTSTDGISWNSITTALTSIKSVTYFNGKYVIVGGSGKIYTSTDLLSWTAKVVTGLNGTLYSVDSTSTLLVIAGYNGTIVTSTDAVNFTIRQTSTINSILSIKYYSDSAIWVAVGANGLVMQSADGLNYSIINTYTDLTDAISDQAKVNGQYVFVAGSGYVMSSFDLAKFTLNQPVNSVSNSAIVATPSKILAVGDSGAIAYSEDGVTYSLQTPATTQNINRIKKLGSVYFAVANGGVYLTSYDGLSWTVRSAGTADLHDIEAKSDLSLYVVVGANGVISTCPDAIATLPIWTAQTSPVATNINQIFYNEASATQMFVAIGESGKVLYSANGTSWALNQYQSNGLLSNGTLKLIFGDNGLVLTSADGITWTKRVTGTNYDLLAGAWDGMKFVLVGANGIAISSNDGITWAVNSTGTTQTINGIAWSGSLFVAVGTGGLAMRSADGVNWTPNYINTAYTCYNVRYINNLFVLVGTTGSAGLIQTSSDGITWTNQTSSTTYSIYDIIWDGAKYVYVGANGTVKYGAMGSWTNASTEGTTADLHGIIKSAQGIYAIVGANGIILTGSNGQKFYVTSSGTGRDLASLVSIGSTFYAIGPDMTIMTSDELLIWNKWIYNPLNESLNGMFDGTNYAMIEASLLSNKLVYSKDGMVWIYVDNKQTGAKKIGKIGSKYALYGYSKSYIYTSTDIAATEWTKEVISSVDSEIVSILEATLNGNALVVYFTSTGSALTGSTGTGLLTATKISLEQVICDLRIVNTIAGTISDAQIFDIAFIGKTVDTTIAEFSGEIDGSVNRSDISFIESIKVGLDANFSDTSFTNESGSKIDVFSLASAVASLVLTNCDIDSAGSMLVYSENADLKLVINGGTIAGGNDTALSNGYAKIYLNSVFDLSGVLIENISAYSLDGSVLESDLATLTSGASLSGDLTHWYHNQKSNLAIDSGAIKVNTAIVLGSELDSVSTLRYRWGTTALRFIKNYGGRIKTTIQFPAGADKDVQAKTKIKAKLYIPEYTSTVYDYDALVSADRMNDAYSAGNTVSMGSSVDAAKLVNYSNVWSGRSDMLPALNQNGHDRYELDRVTDAYGDYPFKMAFSDSNGRYFRTDWLFGHPIMGGTFGAALPDSENYSFEAYVVLVADEDVLLPAGTTIKVELECKLPKSIEMLHKFYSADDELGLDSVTGIEKVYLHYKGISDGVFKTTLAKNSNSATKGEKEYLSVVDKTSYDSVTHVTTYYQVADAYEWTLNGLLMHQHLNPEVNLEYTYALIGYDFEIQLVGLYPANMAAKTFGGAQASNISMSNVQVSNTSSPASDPYFIHSLDKHLKRKNDSAFDLIDKVITKRFFIPLAT